MRKLYNSLFFFFIVVIIANIIHSPLSEFFPMNCIDSDGDCNVERIKYLDNEYEMIDLLYYPFGYLIARDFEIEIPDENEIDYVNISVFWYTDIGE
ncbi:MAG: hypothetical protein QXI77_01085, partial [Nanopusillaceae archaeon]